MEIADLKNELKECYDIKTKTCKIVQVPTIRYLMIDGFGDPNDSAVFESRVGALYSVAYKLKFSQKKSGNDFKVMPLEGLWWVENLSQLDMKKRDNWLWTLMIAVPQSVATIDFQKVVDELKTKKKELPILQTRMADYDEGSAAQLLHIGAYADESPNIDKLHRFVEEKGTRLTGKHHEIYMTSVNKEHPEKMRTILRHPVEKV